MDSPRIGTRAGNAATATVQLFADITPKGGDVKVGEDNGQSSRAVTTDARKIMKKEK